MDQRPSYLNSSFSYAFTYDVFLSFRGSDTRYGFTGNLFKALSGTGIHTFIDDRELHGGDQIQPSLLKAIDESRIAIPIFSINYASSSFCLDELVNIMKRKDIMLIVPIFYKIDPSEVRHQKGKYGKALAKHENKYKVKKKKLEEWKRALHQAADLSGYHFKDRDGYESDFIEKIVKLVSTKINRTPLYVADYPVGLESQIQKVKKLLDFQPQKGANLVGIYGPGGMGKTTLAIAIYNLIADHFEGLCFLENVRENSKKHGLKHLQGVLLEKLFGEKEISLASVNEGISILQHRLQGKKVLLILDDVDKEEQLQAIVGRPDLYGEGSKIIITTRDKQLLACQEVEKLYEVKELDKQDALQLLKHKAFKSKPVDPSYENILERALTYASGLPLAVEVIGSTLHGKRVEDWESALNKYERISNNKIIEVLKISFEDLDEEEKNVFLDIACCFKGYNCEEVNEILCAHYGNNMKHHITVLIDKSLLKIDLYTVKMHDLIEEMGKEIVRRESPTEFGRRSRLGFHLDVIDVLQQSEEFNQIEMIFLHFPFSEKEKEVKWDGEGFGKMKNLKTLIIKNGVFNKGPNNLPNSLRVLEWNNYPSKDLPSDFCPKKLVICKLPYGYLSSQALTGLLSREEFVNVTNLNFDWCEFLTEMPNISCLERLETLSFKYCHNLSKIHNSVGSLKKLKSLEASGCEELRSFPQLELTSLEWLDLSNCRRLERFPEVSARMENIQHFALRGTPIKEFPRSLRNLTALRSLRADSIGEEGNVGSSFIQTIATMPELFFVEVSGMEGWEMPKESEAEEIVCSSNVGIIEFHSCKLTDESFLLFPTWFANVKELNLVKEDFITIVPECIKECSSLGKLKFWDCSHLEEIRGIPPNLYYFEAIECPKMSEWSSRMLLKKELHQAGNTEEFIVPLTPIPEWLDHHRKGNSVSFWFRNNLPQLLLCFALSEQHDLLESNSSWLQFNMFINGILCYHNIFVCQINYTYLFNLNERSFSCNPIFEILSEYEWYFVEVKCTKWDFEKIVDGTIESGILVLKGSMEDICFTHPYENIELEDNGDRSESQNSQLLEEHIPQHLGFWSRKWNQACSCFPFLPPPPMRSLDDTVNEDSRSMVST